jgi:hypothetical protein
MARRSPDTRPEETGALVPHALLRLQRSVGNRAAGRFLEAAPHVLERSCCGHCATGRPCEDDTEPEPDVVRRGRRALRASVLARAAKAPQSALMRQELFESTEDVLPGSADDELHEPAGEAYSYASQEYVASSQRAKAKKPKTKPAPKPPDHIPTATSASEGALKALAAAKRLHDQQDPAIWFDSWGNDLRDNNLNGAIDDKTEQHLSDGSHHAKTHKAKICSSPADTTDTCSPSDQSVIDVQYKVCIDIPIESYKAAGANVSTSRWIPTFFSEIRAKPNWTVWKAPSAPAELLDGDVVAASNPDHQHAGIVETGLVYNSVINLPGPSAARKFHVFNPSGKNDMVSVPRVLFESFLGIDWIARLNK